MGTRIHKTLGWGFKYCRFKKDPRFNEKFFGDDVDYLDQMVEVNSKNKQSEDYKTKSDATWFEAWVNGKGMYDNEPIKHLDQYDFVKYNNYLDTSKDVGTVVFTDPAHKKWNRYGDIIDYYEAERDDRGYYPDYVKFILDGAGQPAQVYPYCAFVNRNGEKIKTSTGTGITQSDRWDVTNLYFESSKKKRKDWKWKETFGVNNIIEWQRHIVPEPPYGIRLFCEVAKPFKNPLTIYRLKPMIFTYWC
jgi:hypothetical protein